LGEKRGRRIVRRKVRKEASQEGDAAETDDGRKEKLFGEGGE